MTDEIKTEIRDVKTLMNGEFYYPMEIIEELMPGFDEITLNVIYLRYNENFIDEQEKKDVLEKIEKLKKKQQTIERIENDLWIQNPENEELIKKRKSD